MKKFRRSTKGDKSTDLGQGAPRISVPQKDAIAINPPKKVIKALFDSNIPHSSSNGDYLAFSQGDFLHVIDREDDPDWYEAANPLNGTRGLVPVNYFESVQKQGAARTSVGVGDHRRGPSVTGGAQYDSGYSEQRNSANGVKPEPQPRVMSMGARAGGGAMVYGIVMYDFKAERPDELEAKEGEPIIVIAQSNPEWFVAKPVARLGGPGLIPVSFIEIRDMASNKAVDDPQEAVRRAGVPKVEEWKRMAAEYKNSSIPLGRLDIGGGAQAIQQGVDRMSLNRQSSNTSGQFSASSQVNHQRNGSSYRSPTVHSQQQQTQSSYTQSSWTPTIAPVRARVPSFIHRAGEFWFQVEAYMEDGKTWSLERNYKQFYQLQMSLLDNFPEAAGKVEGHSRTLPFMPGPLPWVTEQLTSERRMHLDTYLTQLLKIDANITNSLWVRDFFMPKSDRDVERMTDENTNGYRTSGGSRESGQFYNNQQASTGNLSNQSGGGGGYATSPPRNQAQGQFRQGSPSSHHRAGSELRSTNGGLASPPPPPMLRNNSSMTTGSAGSGSGMASGSANAAVRIKVWFSDSNCVVIRLPGNFGYDDLVNKLRDRWSLEPGVDRDAAQDAEFSIEYRDEHSQNYYPIYSEDDLLIARQRNEKLTLKVQASSGIE